MWVHTCIYVLVLVLLIWRNNNNMTSCTPGENEKGGGRLSPLGSAATMGLLYQSQMTDDGECGAIGGQKIGRGKLKYSEKTCPTTTLSTTNPT
jgi:hypothetical protein